MKAMWVVIVRTRAEVVPLHFAADIQSYGRTYGAT